MVAPLDFTQLKERHRELRDDFPKALALRSHHAQLLLSAQGLVTKPFRHDRHLMSDYSYRELRAWAFDVWNYLTRVAPAM